MKPKTQQLKNEEAPGAGTPGASKSDQPVQRKADMANSSTVTESSQLPVIAGHEIAIDEHGRFNLNAIHKASGEGKSKAPSTWTVTKQAKELVQAVADQTKNSGFDPIESIRGGRAPGTFAHELLAVSYAGWISPSFQLQVNQVFLDYRMGKLHAVEQQQKALPNPLTPDHQRGVQKAVARRAQALPKGLQRLAYSRLYSHLKDRFDVAKYDQIPDELYTEALGAVESYTFSGDFLEAETLPQANPVKVLDIDEWLNMNHYMKCRQTNSARLLVTAKFLLDSEYRSPCMRLVKELEAEGHNLDACRLEIASLRHHLESAVSKLEHVISMAQGVNIQAVSFAR